MNEEALTTSERDFSNVVPREDFTAALDFLKANPSQLMQIQAIRTWICSQRAERLSKDLQVSNSSLARKGTVNHNSVSLQSLLGFDRGSQLIQPLLADSYFASHIQWLDFLVIGPRNEAEILCLASHGAKRERVTAIDLISYSPFVEIGDMHSLKCKDNSIDVLLAGWVLAYSSDPAIALNELFRVIRPGGYLCIGWDIAINPKDTYTFKSPFNTNPESTLDPNDSLTIRSTADIARLLRLCNHSFHTVYANNAKFPYDSSGRQNILVVRKCKESDCAYYHSLLRESVAVKQTLDEVAASSLPESDTKRIKHRLISHIDWLFTRTFDDVAYRMMRYDFFAGINVDIALSRNITRQLPPIWSTSSDYSTSFPIPQTISCGFSGPNHEEISSHIATNGFAVYPTTIDSIRVRSLNTLVDYLTAEQAKDSTRLEQYPSKRQFLDEARLWSYPELAEVAFDQLLLQVASDYLGTTPIISSINVFITDSGSIDEAQVSSDAQLFHRDKDLPMFLKVFIYLNDVHSDNGPHQLIQGSHKGDKLFQYLEDRRFSNEEVVSAFPQSHCEITGKAGTFFFVDTRCLHRGKPVKSGTRRVVQIEYCNSLFGADRPKISRKILFDSLPYLAELYADLPRPFERFSD